MKLLILLSVFIALAANTLALKNEICGLSEPSNPNNTVLCFIQITSWSYDINHKKCVKYNYGGCGSSANIFSSKEKCEKMCLE
ncbi:kunitz-type serine protease inhibitor 2-like [Drosophila teissieri]|uniref:kunitz-type serine protease inhibitor 2-like n=1 Tax=Drosophila teissieri TaxID=7243 RepID=UPI001CBA1218|nr:kunitz-type serine protease inhibitor 2-like [Drosophila teissieri]